MIMNIENPDALRVWLSATLAPICDADPAALAKYVMALLKKEKSEQDLKDFCVDQLDVFLQRETKPFVDKLFTVIKDRSYLAPPAKTSSSDTPTTEVSPGTAAVAANSRKSPSGTAADASTVSRQSVQTSSASGAGRSGRSDSRPARKRSSSPSNRRGTDYQFSRSRSRERLGGGGSRTGGSDRRYEQRQPREQQRREIDKENRSARSKKSPAPTAAAASSSTANNTTTTDEAGRTRVNAPRKGDRGESSGSDEDKQNKKRKKLRCRDFDEKGFCMRGDLCPYDHGPDPVVVDDIALPTMISITSGGPAVKPPSTPGGTPNFAIPPPGYGPAAPSVHPPPPGLDSGSYQQAEGYNPEAPAMSVAVPPPGYNRPPPPSGIAVTSGPRHPPPMWAQQPPPPAMFLPHPQTSVGVSVTGAPPLPVPMPVPMPLVVNRSGAPTGRELITLADSADGSAPRTVLAASMPVPSMIPFRPPTMGNKRPLGKGPGMTGIRAPMPYDKTNCTLEVRRIPFQLNTISKLNEHFSQFGHIVNIQVRYENDPEAALVTFATRPQAVGAYKSTAPILNNRFIKIFWHDKESSADAAAGSNSNAQMSGGRPSIKDRLGLPPSTQVKQQEADSGDISMRARGSSPPVDEDGNRRAVLLTTSGNLTRTVYNPDALAAAASQKAAGKTTTTTEPPATFTHKTSLPPHMLHPKMARKQHELEEAMKKSLELQKAKAELLRKQVGQQKLLLAQLEKCTNAAQKKEIFKTIKSLEKTIKASAEDLAKAAKQTPVPSAKPKEILEKEVLDMELELIRQRQAGADAGDLQRRLTEVRLELTAQLARSLSSADQKTLATSTPVQSIVEGMRPHMRKRRVVPETAVLDKRPKDLAISGFNTDEKDALIEHLQHYGMLEDIEFHHSKADPLACRATAVYKTRREAETALAHGGQFRDHQLTIQWAHQRAASVSDAGAVAAGTGDQLPAVEMTAEEILASLDDDDDDDEDEEEEDEEGSEGRDEGNGQDEPGQGEDDDDEPLNAGDEQQGGWKRAGP